MTTSTDQLSTRSGTARHAHAEAVQLNIRDITDQLAAVLGRQLVALLIGKDSRTVLRWVKGENLPAVEDDRRLRDVFQIYRVVSEADAPHVVRAWFMGMNPQLDDASPAEFLAEGKVREVMMAARAFVQGG